MFWVHFTREFYRLADEQRMAASPASTIAAPTASVQPTETSPPPALRSLPPATVSFFDDLPQVDAMKARIRELEASLAVADRAREAFLASMSHELRTPLNAIMGFSEMMKQGVFGEVENPTYREYAGHIHQSGTSLLGKINDLLDIASLDAGGTLMEEEDFNLAELFDEVVEMFSHHAFARDQQIKRDCAANIRLNADRRKLLCALSHFLSNALRHSKDGAAITLMARIQPDDGVILSVRDEGEGIAPKQLQAMREALQRDGTYRHIEPGGIGLGLALSRELAAQHEGRLMLDSIRHRGTVVSMILPKERILAGMPAKRKRSF